MVGPYGHWLRFVYDSPCHVIAERDCCRILTTTTCELLQRVPASTEAIRRIGSTDPAAILFDAMEAFEEGDVKADESIRSIEDAKLQQAVQACVSAAAGSFSTTLQTKYLKAATYGMGFCANSDPTEFVETSKMVRVLNQVRNPLVGLPLTTEQYRRLTPASLLDRIIHRRLYILALAICQYLNVSKHKVLTHWACEFLSSPKASSMTDEELRDVIREKLLVCQDMSYTTVALQAFDHGKGRKRLATMLLDFEPEPVQQVRLLLHMGEREVALQKVVNSLNTNLLFMVLVDSLNALRAATPESREAFYQTVKASPEAAALLKRYLRYHMLHGRDREEQDRFQAFLKNKKDFLELGTLSVSKAYQKRTMDERIQELKVASVFFSQARDLSTQAKVTEEQIELLEVQQRLEAKFKTRCFVDMSVSETIFNLFALGHEGKDTSTRKELFQEADRIQKHFKVPDRRFWHVKVKALARSGQWKELKQFANQKKPPIGFAPFARACMEFGASEDEVAYYIERVQNLEDRCSLFMQVKRWNKAVECAQKLKDPEKLLHIRAVCKDPKVTQFIEQTLAQWSS